MFLAFLTSYNLHKVTSLNACMMTELVALVNMLVITRSFYTGYISHWERLMLSPCCQT